jgi:crotonobetainyl-CoA:carnitine CoA-transferase CaiB-like acyl-CoA transferase
VRNKDVLLPMIAAVLKTRPRDAWITALEAAGVPCAPVNDIGEVAASAQFAAVDITQPLPGGGPRVVGLPISFDGVRPRSARGAPSLGEHNAEVLGRGASQDPPAR